MIENARSAQAAARIIETVIVPRFKAGDLPGGIEAGADAIIARLTRSAEPVPASGASPNAATVW